MTLDPDALVDRRRTRRKLFFWRTAAFVIAVVAVAVFALDIGGDRFGAASRPQIARVSISGLIVADRRTDELLARIADNPAIQGVVIDIDSPGGTTVGGERLYTALRKLAERKPVVASMGTLAASAAYMAAIATDHIVAERTTITGSIGVLIQYGNVGRLFETLGIEVKAVKSAPLKAEPSPFTYPTQPGATDMLGRLVDDTYGWFVDIVAERRHLDHAVALKLADGSVYSGRQALEAGLVDEIGGEAEAIAWLATRGVATGLPVRDWRPDNSFSVTGLGSAAIVAAGRTVGLDLSALSPLPSLDGLVSVWHPQGLETN